MTMCVSDNFDMLVTDFLQRLNNISNKSLTYELW